MEVKRVVMTFECHHSISKYTTLTRWQQKTITTNTLYYHFLTFLWQGRIKMFPCVNWRQMNDWLSTVSYSILGHFLKCVYRNVVSCLCLNQVLTAVTPTDSYSCWNSSLIHEKLFQFVSHLIHLSIRNDENNIFNWYSMQVSDSLMIYSYYKIGNIKLAKN